MTAHPQDLKELVRDLEQAPFKINIKTKDIQVVDNAKEMIEKLKAKERELLDNMKLFA